MKSLEESICMAMDCADKAIIPYLPYILHDFWEIGSNPETIIQLTKIHAKNDAPLKALDLGCGKGAVAVKMAFELGCECFGIDAISEFVTIAEAKAAEFGVGDLCSFKAGDVREMVKTAGKYDVIILGAIGPVFGNYHETLSLLNPNLNPNGVFIIDDGYMDDQSSFLRPNVLRKNEMLQQISDAGFHLIDEVVVAPDLNAAENYDIEFQNLSKRCLELAAKYPGKAAIFENYMKRQKEEYNDLKTLIICSTMVLRRK